MSNIYWRIISFKLNRWKFSPTQSIYCHVSLYQVLLTWSFNIFNSVMLRQLLLMSTISFSFSFFSNIYTDESKKYNYNRNVSCTTATIVQEFRDIEWVPHGTHIVGPL
jgi:hypothetical protein